MRAPIVALIVTAVVLGAARELAGCSPSRRSASDQHASAEAVLMGTCVDAETGARVAGATVGAPGGKSATSDRNGRFEIHGLRSGEGGVVTASDSDGRRASLTLRPLAPGTLEVVLQLAWTR
jgi:hypothetical protein